ncbi:hypothetical protein [Thalassoglobus polymorphus]|uniref:Uncharacterized protein n=1 Tax=Thalassoglobus polymorphus TaxID=2527994 RepID=A0A517QT59_9PLAN|nr:hypothetical protein [Thalassoglobus polymorphus]QDT34825.1 hypothetical protein Mal48_40970 [Thalassoglobus polymorphus]
MSKRYSDRKMPSDQYAELVLVGCGLKHSFPHHFDPVWFYDQRLRVLFLAITTLNKTGKLVAVKNCYCYHESMQVGLENSRKVIQLVERSKAWEYPAPAHYWCEQSLRAATIPQLVDYYALRMKALYHQRWEIWEAEDRLRAAWRVVACR